jgi:hypothetical protein
LDGRAASSFLCRRAAARANADLSRNGASLPGQQRDMVGAFLAKRLVGLPAL